MLAITVDDTLALPRILWPDPAASKPRPVAEVTTAHRQVEGAGFSVRRPFPGELSLARADLFLLPTTLTRTGRAVWVRLPPEMSMR